MGRHAGSAKNSRRSGQKTYSSLLVRQTQRTTLRLRRTRSHIFAFNYSAAPIDTAPLGLGIPVLGEVQLGQAQVTVWSRI